MKASAHPLPGMARVLIEMGANVNAYRRGSRRATALHHAADSGAEMVVKLLIIHGADPHIKNDYGETSLELARKKGHLSVVWAIEREICKFRGWMREKYGPDSFMTNKIWAVVLPCEAQNPTRPLKLELAIYHSSQLSLRKWRLLASQNTKPHVVIELWKSQIEEGRLNEEDPSITIFDKETESRHEILSADEGDKQMLHRFYDALRGTTEVVNTVPVQPADPPLPANPPLALRYVELARAINALVQSARADETVPHVQAGVSSANTVDWGNLRNNYLRRYDRPDALAPSMISGHAQVNPTRYNGRGVQGTSYNQKNPDASSAEPVKSEANASSSSNPWRRRCVICLDAPVEGACVPCGHMAFCMPCLENVKSKKGPCPICRAAINQVIRLYQV
ncbi:unnamed protein product [Urochloa decumbens]|uniref:RING-type domain-containing protein n=1 Tax=Urochloa decumbens TaxID=240449 RepID=A0ABC9FQ05_9POAL